MTGTNALNLCRRIGGAALCLLLVSACASNGNETSATPAPEPPAENGAVAARALGGRDNLAFSLMGGAALGGELGSALNNREGETRPAAEPTAGRRTDDRRQLAYDRQSERQRELVRREVTKQRLFEDVRRERLSAPDSKRTTASIATAQRYLKAQGLYDGHVDGVMGQQTRDAIVRYQARNNLPQDGSITPVMIDKMRSAL
ncbi:MAG TPA: peptidoglycan-binding domain-containing protein [Defluviicoccus sp.]|nr:peptidoglycan-binding domain-containing protein [Defluviicoccus sp.]